jgi:hypothetical protein
MIAMGIGSEVEVHGRVVVASPYEHEVELENFRGDEVKLSEFNNMAWIWSPLKAALRNVGDNPAKVVLFQIGRADEELLLVQKQVEPTKSLRTRADEPDKLGLW